MNWIAFLPVVISLLTIVILFRHLFYRTRYYLHMFQQIGYKQGEFVDWLANYNLKRVFGIEYIFLFGLLILIEFYLDTFITYNALSSALFIYILFWFLPSDYYKGEKVKKKLVSTARMKRLYITTVILSVFIPSLAFTYLTKFEEPFFMRLPFIVFALLSSLVLTPWVVYLAGWFNRPTENGIQEGFKNDARQKLASLPHLKTVAITGSYGKTSTKYMIQAILKERYSVCFTPGSFNTPMGICKIINNELNATHQILVLEMGARYVGNIEELCDIAQPDISVVTNVGLAHLETFGSQANIAKTKGEIVDALADDSGVAILNADDFYVSKMGAKRPIKRLTYGLEHGDIRAENIRYGVDGCRFTVHLFDQSAEVHTPLLGKHNVQNLLSAFAVGYELGLRLETMVLAASKLEPTEHRLELKKIGHYFMIDDAFNSNPVGSKNAVEILAQFEECNRYIITPGMVELGAKEDEENKIFGTHIGQAKLEGVVLVGEKKTKPIYEGIQASGYDMSKVFVANSLDEANNHVLGKLKAGDVVLYENDLPDSYNE